MNQQKGKPVKIAYFYKVKWGFQDEFIALFKKNHYPVLKKQVESGRLLDVELYEPKFHQDGTGSWSFLSVLTFKDWQAIAQSESKTIVEELYPDQETFKREEQRRFEILETHWDVPLKEVPAE